jgi:hypothetical protein
LFFDTSVRASLARIMGTWLLTETMSRRYEIPMNTYDRFFPNQDTLPKGGFGNLIALPLQKVAGEEGNTLFLDSDSKLSPISGISSKQFTGSAGSNLRGSSNPPKVTGRSPGQAVDSRRTMRNRGCPCPRDASHRTRSAVRCRRK